VAGRCLVNNAPPSIGGLIGWLFLAFLIFLACSLIWNAIKHASHKPIQLGDGTIGVIILGVIAFWARRSIMRRHHSKTPASPTVGHRR
jgi:nitrate reductase gamma subunit